MAAGRKALARGVAPSGLGKDFMQNLRGIERKLTALVYFLSTLQIV
jgi:hypothetical protein